jgi:hypothetical protein
MSPWLVRRLRCLSAYLPSETKVSMTNTRITIAAIPATANTNRLVTPIFSTTRPKKPNALPSRLLGRNSLTLSPPESPLFPQGSPSSSNRSKGAGYPCPSGHPPPDIATSAFRCPPAPCHPHGTQARTGAYTLTTCGSECEADRYLLSMDKEDPSMTFGSHPG